MVDWIKARLAWVGAGFAALAAFAAMFYRSQRDRARHRAENAEREAEHQEQRAETRNRVEAARNEVRRESASNERKQQERKSRGDRPDRFGDGRLRDDD